MTGPVARTVHLRYFAALREALGTGGETLQTQATTPAALRAELAGRGGAYAQALAPQRAVRMAVDQVMARGDEPLADGAEVAFFPPVTGG